MRSERQGLGIQGPVTDEPLRQTLYLTEGIPFAAPDIVVDYFVGSNYVQ